MCVWSNMLSVLNYSGKTFYLCQVEHEAIVFRLKYMNQDITEKAQWQALNWFSFLFCYQYELEGHGSKQGISLEFHWLFSFKVRHLRVYYYTSCCERSSRMPWTHVIDEGTEGYEGWTSRVLARPRKHGPCMAHTPSTALKSRDPWRWNCQGKCISTKSKGDCRMMYMHMDFAIWQFAPGQDWWQPPVRSLQMKK